MTDAYETPPSASTVRCEYCDRPFAREEYRALHRGLAHESEMDDDERDEFARAREDETDELRKFRLKALAVLVALYFTLLMAYAVYA
jgi:hypothetical protein